MAEGHIITKHHKSRMLRSLSDIGHRILRAVLKHTFTYEDVFKALSQSTVHKCSLNPIIGAVNDEYLEVIALERFAIQTLFCIDLKNRITLLKYDASRVYSVDDGVSMTILSGRHIAPWTLVEVIADDKCVHINRRTKDGFKLEWADPDIVDKIITYLGQSHASCLACRRPT